MVLEYDSGYESENGGFDMDEILAGDHDDVPLDILVQNLN